MLKERSLRFKINVTIVLVQLLITVVFGSVLAVYETQRRNEAIAQIHASLLDLTRQYEEQLGNEIFSQQTLAIEETLRDIMQRRNILGISTFDESGKLLVTTTTATAQELPEQELSFSDFDKQAALNFFSPITAYNEQVGFWQIHYSLTLINHQTLEIVAIFVTLLLTLSLLLGLLLNHILSSFILKPVYALSHAMGYIHTQAQEASASELSQTANQRITELLTSFNKNPQFVAARDNTDEIGALAQSFRKMLQALQQAHIGQRTDKLTALYNRVMLDETLALEISMSERHQHPFAVIISDIDHFKTINDNYGHLTGDKVLQGIAELLKGNLRKTDLAGRWGGEEFLLILRQQGTAEAALLAEKLRRVIAEHPFPTIGSVTASFGIAEFQTGDSALTLLSRADAALYQAKGNGRNQVVTGPWTTTKCSHTDQMKQSERA